MPRDLHPDTSAALALNGVGYAVLAMITFRSSVQWLWSGPHDLTVAGQVYKGVGSLGTLGEIVEGSDGKAEGTSLTLSGIDPVFLAASLTDVQQGAPAKVWLALMDGQMQVIGEPYLWFAGEVGKPTVPVAGDSIGITLPLETSLAGHERASGLKYTNADQRLLYPDDTAFVHVERLNDVALRIAN